MLTDLTKSLSINARSTVGDNETIAYMSANIALPGGISFNQSIQSRAKYMENKAEADSDYEEFRQKVEQISMQFESEEE